MKEENNRPLEFTEKQVREDRERICYILSLRFYVLCGSHIPQLHIIQNFDIL